MSSDDEGYVTRWKLVAERVKIPPDCVRCPDCDGSGEIRLYYGSLLASRRSRTTAAFSS